MSVEQMFQLLGIEREEYRNLSETERQTEYGKSLLKRISELDARMKEEDRKIGVTHGPGGNYKTGLK